MWSKMRSKNLTKNGNVAFLDLEDLSEVPILENKKEIIDDIIQSEPKIQLSYEKKSIYFSSCKSCYKTGCLLSSKTPGYYHIDHVAEHNKANDCWIVAHGIVYDVTRYLSKHPGGARSILSRAGKDATADFDFHTRFCKNRVWSRYAIGKVAYCNEGINISEPCCIF